MRKPKIKKTYKRGSYKEAKSIQRKKLEMSKSL